MKLIIDIPEEEYKLLQNSSFHTVIEECVRNGTPIPDNATVCDIEQIMDEIEKVKAIMNEEIINHDRKDLINFVNGLNQSLVIIDKYRE